MSTPWWTVTVAGGVISPGRAGRRRTPRPPRRSPGPRRRRRPGTGCARGTSCSSSRWTRSTVVRSWREHRRLQRLEVVVEVGEALARGGGEDQVAGAGVGDLRRERGVEVVGVPARARRARRRAGRPATSSTCGTTLVSVAVTTPLVPCGVRRGPSPAWRVEDQRAGAVALGERDRGRDRRVAAERHLGLGAEVADVVAAVRRAGVDERGLAVAEVGGDLLHLGVVEGARRRARRRPGCRPRGCR